MSDNLFATVKNEWRVPFSWRFEFVINQLIGSKDFRKLDLMIGKPRNYTLRESIVESLK